jgi:hypothetical protein
MIYKAMVWVSVHLPFIMGYVLSGAALSRLVVAHDCDNANPETLTELYQERSEPELSDAIRWFYCGGLAVALFSMNIISFCHVHRKVIGQRWRKRSRLIFRTAIAIIIACLPMAHELSSIGLIGTTCSFMVLVVFIEIWGTSCIQDSFLCDKGNCKYLAKAHLKKRQIEGLKAGESIDIDDLSPTTTQGSGGNEKAFMESM